MFYYPNVLQRHTGCFSTIWLAATKGIRITRREFLRVNIGKTCEDIIDYVEVQVPPLHPSLPRPRFSLYLSSQLQYGVVIVFHRQCALLLEEVQQTIERLLRSEKHSQIDMQEPDRLALNLPDSLFLLKEAEGALAPFFGKMGAECEVPSLYQLPQPWQFMTALSPESPLETSKENPAPIGLTAPPETITIKDKEPVTILSAEFGGAELPEVTAQEIDMLMKQQDQFLLGEMEDKERDRAAEGERTRELEAAMVSLEQLKDITFEDKSCIIEDTGQTLDVAMHMVATEMTPPPTTIPATTEASERDQEQEKGAGHCSSEISMAEEGIPPERRSRKRQLIFADQHTQISQDAMREQINNPLTETQSLSDVLVKILPTVKISSSHVFSSSCNLLLHFDLQSLWKQCCIPIILPDPTKINGLQEHSELSEMERERGGEKDEGWKKRESSREVLRESAEAGLLFSEVSAASDVALDVSKGDRPQSDLITHTSRWSPLDEAALHMEAILEERVELQQEETETREITPHSLLKLLNTYIDRFGKVSFHSLLPLEAERSIAAHLFYNVLELACVGKLSVNQTGPYGPITICSGRL